MSALGQRAAELTVRLKSVVLEAGPLRTSQDGAVPLAEVSNGDVVGGPELVERVVLAFCRMPPTEIERRIIEVLLERPGATLVALSTACGWSRPIWHTHFNLMVRRRAGWLGGGQGDFPAAVLVEYDSEACTFTMRPEAAAVFAEMGIGPL